MDEDGYPTEEELSTIRNWSADDFTGLMEYIRERWAFGNMGYFVEDSKGVYYLSTAGWSGNESLIKALQENTLIETMHWYAHRRGGHYVYATLDGMNTLDGWAAL